MIVGRSGNGTGRRAGWGRVLVLLAGLLVAAPAVPAAPPEAAARPEAAAEAVSTAELEALLASLEDEAERAKLIAQIRALIAARKAAAPAAPGLGARLIEAVSAWMEGASSGSRRT